MLYLMFVLYLYLVLFIREKELLITLNKSGVAQEARSREEGGQSERKSRFGETFCVRKASDAFTIVCKCA